MGEAGLSKTIREWTPIVAMLCALIVWVVAGQTTANVVSRDLRTLTEATRRERDALGVELRALAKDVKALSLAQAEAKAERRALRDTLKRIEGACCAGR